MVTVGTPHLAGTGRGVALAASGSVVWHELWDGRPDEIAAAIDPDYDHASWSENFSWTRLPGVAIPAERKPPVEWPENGNPETWREALGDGSFGGLYQRSAEDEKKVWEAAVQAIRDRLERWELRLDRGVFEGVALGVGDDARRAGLLVAGDEHRLRLGRHLAVASQDPLACGYALRPEPLERAAGDDDVVLEGQLAPVVDLDPRDHVAPHERRILEDAP